MVIPSAVAPDIAKAEIVGVKRQRHRLESSGLLDVWLKQNNNNLYPSKDEKEKLVKETMLNYNQVSRWFANRRRKLKLRHCSSPVSSTAVERNSVSPLDNIPDIPDSTSRIYPQASTCPQTTAVTNGVDGYFNTGGINGVIESLTMLENGERQHLDSNNNTPESEIILKNSIQQEQQVTGVTHDQLVPPTSVTSQQLSALENTKNQNNHSIFKPQDHLPTPVPFPSGIYPHHLSGGNPFSSPSPVLGLHSPGFDFPGLWNPYILSALASGTGVFPAPVSNPWMQNGFFSSLFSNPLLSPPETVASTDDKALFRNHVTLNLLMSEVLRQAEGLESKEILEEEEAKKEEFVAEEQDDEANHFLSGHDGETKDAETERLLMELTEKESIAVSVLAEFALQRKQREEVSVLV